LGEFIVFTIYGTLTPGQEIPLIYAIAVGLATAIIIGLPVAKYTSKPIPPKKAARVGRVRHKPQILDQAKYILALILIIQAVSLALGVNSHLQGLYSLAAIYFGISIMALGWVIFIAKVITLDIPYITRQKEVKI
jgi:hypothetical protein